MMVKFRIGKKESMLGILFAIITSLFINYTSIERIINMESVNNLNRINSLLFPIFWYIIASLLFYELFSYIFNKLHSKSSNMRLVVIVLVAITVASYILVEFYPFMRDFMLKGDIPQSRPQRGVAMPKGPHALVYKHLLVAVLNLLFVYILRLLYRNAEIARANEQLQLESIKSQHTALLQQINPHFFFNSLNSLRYIIVKNENDIALEFLDNLTTIFRKTLKTNNSNKHPLSEEMEITNSYLHILKKRFEGKIDISVNINNEYNDCMLPPLALLTLIENITKHNKVSASSPIVISIYSTEDREIVVENSVHPKFETVESNGLGLENLNSRYKLLVNRGILIENNEKIFRVRIPLI